MACSVSSNRAAEALVVHGRQRGLVGRPQAEQHHAAVFICGISSRLSSRVRHVASAGKLVQMCQCVAHVEDCFKLCPVECVASQTKRSRGRMWLAMQCG
jgi:hypothetical protein